MTVRGLVSGRWPRSALLGLGLGMALLGCSVQRPPGDGQGTIRRMDFVAVNGDAEGLLLQLPGDYRGFPEKRLPQGYLKVYRPREGYQPQDELTRTVTRGIDLDVLPMPPPPVAAELTPEKMMLITAMGYRQKDCSAGFAAIPLGPLSDPVRPGFAALLGCGRTPQGLSDTTLAVAMKGRTELYILGWFERGAAQDGPPQLDLARWKERLRMLRLSLCPVERSGTSTQGPPSPTCVVQALR